MRGNHKNGHEAHKASYFMIVSYSMLAYNKVFKFFFSQTSEMRAAAFHPDGGSIAVGFKAGGWVSTRHSMENGMWKPKTKSKNKDKKNGIVVYVASYVAVRIFASCCVYILLMNF